MQFQQDSTPNVRGITRVLDIRSKNNSFRQGKIRRETAIARTAYIVLRCEQVWTGVNNCKQFWIVLDRLEQVRAGVKYCLPWMVSRTLSKFCLPFDEATTSVHFPKALKCPRNNVVPASHLYYTIYRHYKNAHTQMIKSWRDRD